MFSSSPVWHSRKFIIIEAIGIVKKSAVSDSVNLLSEMSGESSPV
jgi:predicted GTPase